MEELFWSMYDVLRNTFLFGLIDIWCAFAWWVFFCRNVLSAIRCFFLLGSGFALLSLILQLSSPYERFVSTRHDYHKVAATGIVGMVVLAAWVAVEIYASNVRLARLQNPTAPAEEEDPDKDLFDHEETNPE